MSAQRILISFFEVCVKRGSVHWVCGSVCVELFALKTNQKVCANNWCSGCECRCVMGVCVMWRVVCVSVYVCVCECDVWCMCFQCMSNSGCQKTFKQMSLTCQTHSHTHPRSYTHNTSASLSNNNNNKRCASVCLCVCAALTFHAHKQMSFQRQLLII